MMCVCVCENVGASLMELKISCLLIMATILFYVTKLGNESRSILLRHRMNVWKGLCVGRCVLTLLH